MGPTLMAWTTKSPIRGNHWVLLSCRALLGLALLSHFRAAKNSGAPKPTPRPTQAPTISPTMKKSPKAPHVRTLFPDREQIIEAFFAGLDVEKVQQSHCFIYYYEMFGETSIQDFALNRSQK